MPVTHQCRQRPATAPTMRDRGCQQENPAGKVRRSRLQVEARAQRRDDIAAVSCGHVCPSSSQCRFHVATAHCPAAQGTAPAPAQPVQRVALAQASRRRAVLGPTCGGAWNSSTRRSSSALSPRGLLDGAVAAPASPEAEGRTGRSSSVYAWYGSHRTEAAAGCKGARQLCGCLSAGGRPPLRWQIRGPGGEHACGHPPTASLAAAGGKGWRCRASLAQPPSFSAFLAPDAASHKLRPTVWHTCCCAHDAQHRARVCGHVVEDFLAQRQRRCSDEQPQQRLYRCMGAWAGQPGVGAVQSVSQVGSRGSASCSASRHVKGPRWRSKESPDPVQLARPGVPGSCTPRAAATHLDWPGHSVA